MIPSGWLLAFEVPEDAEAEEIAARVPVHLRADFEKGRADRRNGIFRYTPDAETRREKG